MRGVHRSELVRFRHRFTSAEWERLASHGESVTFEAGAVVLRRGDPPEWFYVIETGTLEIVDPRTNPVTLLGVLGDGQPVGEISFVNGSTVSADVRVRERATCHRFEVHRLAAALQQDPELEAAFYRTMAGSLAARVGALTLSTISGGFGGGVVLTGESDARPSDDAAESVDPHLASILDGQGDVAVRRVRLADERVTIGRSPSCGIELRDPRASHVYAELVRVDDEWRVVSTGTRAVVVDGVAVASAPVRDGSLLQVGRTSLRRVGDHVEILPPAPAFALHVEHLGARLGARTLLDDVGFSVLSGEVLAIVGPSGAGKTTLLDLLSTGGRSASATTLAVRGRIRLGDHDLGAVLERLPTFAAVVPQDDIVLPELTVEESLRYAARLRLPADEADRRGPAVNRVLSDLGLDRIRGSRIGDPEARGISGGQRKRVNIGQELLGDQTRILFLDEPTSGLDPRSAGDIARLARRLADAGRIVVLVTHDLSDPVLAQVDQLLVLAPGGRLAWFGPPEEACAHFGVPTAAALFDRLVDHSPAEWAERYASSTSASRWVRLRRVVADRSLAPFTPPAADDRPTWLGHWALLAGRSALVKVRDRTSLAVLCLQPLLVGIVILLIFPQATAGLMFLLVLSCFWFGMSASVRELLVDRTVWRREQGIGVTPSAWVLAKATIVALAVALQCAFVAGLTWAGVGLSEHGFSLPGLVATAVLTGFVGVSTGLAVSAAARRTEAAVGTIVLLLVPQIAFSGILMPLHDVTPTARLLAWLTPVRYAFHLALQMGETLDYQGLTEWKERLVSGELYLLGLRPEGAGSLGLPPLVLAGALLALAVAQIGATILRVRRRGW